MPSPMFLSSPGVRQPGMLLTTPLNTVILGGSLHFSEPLFNNRPWKKKKTTIGLEWFDVVHIIYLLLVGWRPEVVVVASLGEVQQQKKMQSQRFLSLQVLRALSSPYMAPGYDHYLAVSLSCSSYFSSSPHPSPSGFPEELQTLLF